VRSREDWVVSFEPSGERYKGRIREVRFAGLVLGGEEAFPFHYFDGAMPHVPAVGFEVWDTRPEEWPPALMDAYGEALADPLAWTRKVVEEFGAEALYLRLMSADPHGENRPLDEVVTGAVRVVASARVPVIVSGPGDPDTDVEVLQAVAEALKDTPVLLASAEESNYRAVGAAALAYGHGVVAFSPIDVNLAKQLNVLLARLGVSEDRILMDPTSGALGYGLEYSYTVFERSRLAALTQNDTAMQAPIVAVVGPDAWKVKEARAGREELPGTGDPELRAVMWEALTAVPLMLAGAELLIVRHPRSAWLVREVAGLMAGE
jgi:acetyl-CoA decarbonylase/synthase complex subunit delta